MYHIRKSKFLSPHGNATRRKPWRKLLWVQQDYPDNWVDNSFLDKLQRNANVVAYDFWPLVADSTVLTQHLSSVVIFVASFISIYTRQLSPLTVIGVSTGLTALAYTFWSLQELQLQREYRKLQSRRETAKSAMLIVLTILGLSPILNSLTLSSDSDSIWTIALYLFLANIVFHDYSTNASANISYPGSLSTNAAIMGSVVLASRLGKSAGVFSLTLFSVEWFALFPIFRRYIRNYSYKYHVGLTILLVFAASFMLASFVSTALAALFVTCMFFISFVCPLWLISLQKYKKYALCRQISMRKLTNLVRYMDRGISRSLSYLRRSDCSYNFNVLV